MLDATLTKGKRGWWSWDPLIFICWVLPHMSLRKRMRYQAKGHLPMILYLLGGTALLTTQQINTIVLLSEWFYPLLDSLYIHCGFLSTLEHVASNSHVPHGWYFPILFEHFEKARDASDSPVLESVWFSSMLWHHQAPPAPSTKGSSCFFFPLSTRGTLF